jgi:hypothetical protein
VNDETRIAIERLQEELGQLPERLAAVLGGGREPDVTDHPQRPGLPEGELPEFRPAGHSAAPETAPETPQRPGLPEADTEEPQQHKPQVEDGPEARLWDVPPESPLAATEDETEEPVKESPFATAATEAGSSGMESKLDEIKTLLTEIRDKLGTGGGASGGDSGGGGPESQVEESTTREFAPVFNGRSVADWFRDSGPTVKVTTKSGRTV